MESEVDLLERTARAIRERYQATTDVQVPRIVSFPTVDDASLWLVPTTAKDDNLNKILFLLMQRLTALASSPILSAFTCPSIKGRVYVEAQSLLAVHNGCSGLPGVVLDKISHVPVDEAISLLRLNTHRFSVSPGDWVRMKAGLYREDLALVLDVGRGGTSSMRVAMIPRLDLAVDDSDSGKRRSSGQSRPAQRLFDQNEIVQACGVESVTCHDDQVFGFRKQEFKNGLLELDVELDDIDLVEGLATPRKSEFREFICNQTVDVRSVE